MFFLNTAAPFESFKKAVNNDIYVDKTLMIESVSHHIGKEKCHISITKPRRFGKSVNASMLAAFYTRGIDSSSVFLNRKIAGSSAAMKHLNSHNVFFISLNEMPRNCKCYEDYITSIEDCLISDVLEAYPQLKGRHFPNLNKMLSATGDGFIFILDEWDAIFYKSFMTDEDKEQYLNFWEGLLKGQPYVELAYMTGVLPIAKYSSGSALNMFVEYSFISDPCFSTYFGFTEDEVRALCEKHSVPSYEEIAYWYNGYYTNSGERLFNPRSVNNALCDGACRSYWTETGPMNEIEECIRHNVDAVRDDIVRLTAGIPVKIKLNGYSASDQRLTDRNEILSAMVVYGFLSYHNQTLRIPNHELMEKFNQTLGKKTMGEVASIVNRSREILEATLHCDADTVASILEDVHDREIPFFKYNDENSLSCVVTLCYLYARDLYRIKREEKSGKGFCDYLFIPLDPSDPAIILELKYGKSAGEAIEQIKRKNYIQQVDTYSEILLVGINYDKHAEKHHQCIIECYKA